MKEELELKNTSLQKFIVDDQYRLLRHVVLLVLLLLAISYSNWQHNYSGQFKFYRLLSVFLAVSAMCYTNMLILVPLFFFKRKYLYYLVTLSLLVLLFQSLLGTLLDRFFRSGIAFKDYPCADLKKGSFEGFMILVPIILVTTMIKLFQRWSRDNERITELKTIALRMELNELKNQINPHFLFNMLNGIKALVRSDPEKANLIIMKLSEFLRYQIYENNEEKTLLKSEITFLSNFLSLEMLRRDHLSVEIKIPEKPGILNGIYIPPNLFTTFVENAVKHSADISGRESFIHISIVLSGNKLHFSCTNSKDPEFISSDKKNSGLGLANIKRRLELLYQDNHSLAIDSTKNQFTITLIVPI